MGEKPDKPWAREIVDQDADAYRYEYLPTIPFLKSVDVNAIELCEVMGCGFEAIETKIGFFTMRSIFEYGLLSSFSFVGSNEYFQIIKMINFTAGKERDFLESLFQKVLSAHGSEDEIQKLLKELRLEEPSTMQPYQVKLEPIAQPVK